MTKLAANLMFLFNEVDLLDRFDAAAGAGFRGVEYQFPYGHDRDALAERLRSHDLTLVGINLPPGNWSAGERGIACHPDRKDEFRDGLEQAIEYAGALGCSQMNCLSGIAPEGVEAARLRATFVDNLAFAARRLGELDLSLVIEPINTRDIPGFYLSRSAEAVAIIDEVGAPNLGLQYDVYHMQVMEGDIVKTMEARRSSIAHVQIADNPGRHEPGTGELNIPFILAELDRLGYDGWVSCEYVPLGDTTSGLAWARPYLQRSNQ
jgi:hydroxypyruvate isomerase